MCGRFGLFARLDAIEDHFDATFTCDYEPQYNIAPEGPGVASIRNASPDAIDQLHWGLVPHWVDDPEDFPTLIDARSGTVAEKPAFGDAFEKRRCPIPASSFYEWTGPKGSRVPHFVGIEERELFAMAGLWETWSSNGEEIQPATILTTVALDGGLYSTRLPSRRDLLLGAHLIRMVAGGLGPPMRGVRPVDEQRTDRFEPRQTRSSHANAANRRRPRVTPRPGAASQRGDGKHPVVELPMDDEGRENRRLILRLSPRTARYRIDNYQILNRIGEQHPGAR